MARRLRSRTNDMCSCIHYTHTDKCGAPQARHAPRWWSALREGRPCFASERMRCREEKQALVTVHVSCGA